MIIQRKVLVPVPLPMYEKKLYSVDFQNSRMTRTGLDRLLLEIRLSVDDICKKILPTGDYLLVNYIGMVCRDKEHPEKLIVVCGSFPYFDESPHEKSLSVFKNNIALFCDKTIKGFVKDCYDIDFKFEVSAYRDLFMKEILLRGKE